MNIQLQREQMFGSKVTDLNPSSNNKQELNDLQVVNRDRIKIHRCFTMTSFVHRTRSKLRTLKSSLSSCSLSIFIHNNFNVR